MYKERFLSSGVKYHTDGLAKYCSTGLNNAGRIAVMTAYADSLPTRFKTCVKDVSLVDFADFVTGEKILSTTKRRPLVSECTHQRYGLVSYPCGYAHRYTENPYEYAINVGCDYYRYPIMGSVIPFTGFLPRPIVDVASAQKRAWWEMQPRFEGEVSLFNSILELKDFKGAALVLPKLYKKLANFNVSNLGNSGMALAHKKRALPGPTKVMDPQTYYIHENLSAPFKTIDKASITAAEGLLTYNYAIRPLIKDIADIVTNLKLSAMKAEEAFKEKGQESHTTHYSESFDAEHNCDTGWTNTFLNLRRTSSGKIFTASLQRKYEYRLRRPEEGFLDYWGLRVTPEVVWNALPFSFLLDYVLQVGNSIRRMEVDQHVTLHDLLYYESLLSYSQSGTFIYNPTTRIYYKGKMKYAGTPAFLSGAEATYYERYFAVPNFGPALPKPVKIKPGQAANVAALLRVFV